MTATDESTSRRPVDSRERDDDLASRWCLRDLSRLTNRGVDNNKNEVRDAAQTRDEKERRGARGRKTKQPSSFRVQWYPSHDNPPPNSVTMPSYHQEHCVVVATPGLSHIVTMSSVEQTITNSCFSPCLSPHVMVTRGPPGPSADD
jgi:hypothetical protein